VRPPQLAGKKAAKPCPVAGANPTLLYPQIDMVEAIAERESNVYQAAAKTITVAALLLPRSEAIETALGNGNFGKSHLR
jgi:hypothetical protein